MANDSPKLAIIGGTNVVPEFQAAAMIVAAAFATITAATLAIKRRGL